MKSPLTDITMISPHKSSPRVYPITKITIHHMAAKLTAEQCGKVFQSREASANYGIGSDGKIGCYVDEDDRSWCSCSYDNDNRAITIEVANDGGAPDWHVADKSLALLIDLCVDICKRHGITELDYTGDATGNLTRHNMFWATACPGPYLQSKFPWIAQTVNARLKEDEKKTVILKIGYASHGDIITFKQLLDALEMSYEEDGGYITTEPMTPSEARGIEAEAQRLQVPYKEIPAEEEGPTEPQEPPEEQPDYETLYTAEKAENERLRTEISRMAEELNALAEEGN